MVKGVSQDYQLAAKWWRRAAEQWYRRAAEQGHVGVQFYLAVMYEKGQVIPQDYQEAVKWYRRAANQGDVEAQSSLGWMYSLGEGVPQDFVLAYKWMHLAAAQGHKDASHNRDFLAKKMNTSQIQEAQKLSREFKPKKEKP